MFIIVLHHYAVHGIRHITNIEMRDIWLTGNNLNKIYTSFLMPGGSIGVGIFFLLTGYFMYGGIYKIHRLVKLLIEVYFYSFIILIIFWILKLFNIYNFPEIKTKTQLIFIINTIIPITSGNWWFIQSYFILFLFIPIINKYIKKLNKKNSIIMIIFVWLFWYSTTIFSFTYSNLQQAVFFYILGAQIKIRNFKINKWISLTLIISIWILFSFVDIKYTELVNNETIKEVVLKLIYKSLKTSVFVPVIVVSFFDFFRNLKINNNKYINIIASTTFGIYLFHDSDVGRQFIWDYIVRCLDVQYKSPFFPILSVISSIIVFGILSGFDYLRHTLFEEKYMLFINKILKKIF
ncbi:acyltransferase family protein [Treponema pedis]|uniref:Acyltransferase family protein n=1 Tax=Treponema pedis TaxID=409322 RepID=A0A7S6WRM0_9SPIR|nr:acyltransferase family protein [Treponema pedis]QOW62084.1 acyltransferase family protein [Treponema pedis]